MDLDLVHSDFVQLTLTKDGLAVDNFTNFEKTNAAWTGTVLDDAGAAQDITGWAIRFNLYDKEGGTLQKSWDTDLNVALTTPLSGIFTLTVRPSDLSTDIDVVHGIYEVAFYDGGVLSGAVTGRVQGPANLLEVEIE